MRGRLKPISASFLPVGLRMSCLLSSTPRAFSSQIIKSPSLLSLDVADTWTSATKQYDCTSVPECLTAKNWTAKIIDGNTIAQGIRSGIASEVSRMEKLTGQVPGLAVIVVGHRRDSQTYVRNKIIACEEHLDEVKILNVVNLEKDVDGFHPLNIGNLAMEGMEPLFIPCTPKGCVELLLQSGIEITGKKAVVVGRSNIVGMPMSLLLQRHHATVTNLHPFTENPEQIACEADILIAAAGVPNLVRASWLKPGAVVVDVGTNPVEDGRSEHGYCLVGDVCFEEATRIASAITPVPGGVGPMTVAMLLYNTLESAKRALE